MVLSIAYMPCMVHGGHDYHTVMTTGNGRSPDLSSLSFEDYCQSEGRTMRDATARRCYSKLRRRLDTIRCLMHYRAVATAPLISEQ